MAELLTIDGAQGEGGGQILRSSVALALVLGRPVRIERVRAGRRRPGLLRQHLTAVRAAAEIGEGSALEGAELGSTTVVFRPGVARGGEHRFAVGSAGSATLVLQTILPPLLLTPEPSSLVLEGGTHNPMAPPFEHLARAFLPLLARMGARVVAVLERHGFYPAGGGRLRVQVEPAAGGRLAPLELLERGGLRGARARAVVANLPRHIAERELGRVRKTLGVADAALELAEVESAGPGNVLSLELESDRLTEVVTGFGEKGVRAERVADLAIREAQRYLRSPAPVGEHLADQLLLPLALAGGGAFRTLRPSSHLRTNVAVVRAFLPSLELRLEERGPDDWQVELRTP